MQIPFITVEQMIEVDRIMIEIYRIKLIQMMENAGRHLATLAKQRFFQNKPIGKKIIILAGPGGNGGGALVCARRLHNWGGKITVFLTKPAADFKGIPAQQLEILSKISVPIFEDAKNPFSKSRDLIIDGMIGYRLRGNPRGTVAEFIHRTNEQRTPILALDVPSGIEAGSGTALNPVIHATATLTLALPKTGFRNHLHPTFFIF